VGSPAKNGLGFSLKSNRITIWSGVTNSFIIDKTLSLSSNVWHHVIVSRSSGTLKSYINTVEETSSSNTHNFTTENLFIGRNINDSSTGGTAWGNQDQAQLRIYKGKGLSASEVLQNYNATKSNYFESITKITFNNLQIGLPPILPKLNQHEIITTNLVLHLDAGNSDSYVGTGTTWTDLSGQGNNGTINGATYNSGNGGYLSFDGTNDYVTLPEIDISGDEVTFTVWNYGISNQYSFLLFLTGNSSNDRVLSVNVPYPYPYNTNQIYFDKGNTSGYDRINFGVTNSEYQGWHHWAFTANASTGSMKIYLDGVLKHSGTGKTRSLSTPADGVQNIGSKDGNSFHIGYVSQVLLYKRELSASEVLQNYNALKSRYGL